MTRFSPRNLAISQMILALVFIGIAGLIVELFLLKHTDSVTQWLPLITLGAGLASTIAVARHESRNTVGGFRIVMSLFVFVGLLGLFFHFKGNIEWALERNSELGGWPLIWKALRGATPALAPGALAQIGLLGLIWAYHWERRT